MRSPLPRLFSVALLLAPFLAARAVAADDRSVFTKAIASSRIWGFMEILRNSGLPEETVDGDVTLLIPIDTAFYKLTPERYKALLSPKNKELATRYIRAHVVKGRWTIAQLAAGGHQTLNGAELTATLSDAGKPSKVNGCPVVFVDQDSSTGMFNLIDGFLLKE
jgi:uncharacterized surface protein with fasciclin (FAS1) repeats